MTKVIAEVANVHEGDLSYMKELVTKLVTTKVDAVKFQYVIPSEFGDPTSENYIELNRLKIEHHEFQELLNIFPKNFTVYFDIFADGSYQNVLKLKADNPHLSISGVKLHVTNSMDFELLAQAARDFEKVFISVSGLTAIEINEIVLFAKQNEIFENIVLVYGVQNYPTKPESIKLNKLSEIKKVFGVAVALSDHLDGDNMIAADMMAFASVLGYDYIEKHVTLNRNRRLDDDHAALNVDELVLGIDKMHMVSQTLTDNVLALSEDEFAYRNKAKQAIFSAKNFQPGTTVKKEDLVMKRQEGEEIEKNLLNLKDVVGKRAAVELLPGQKIKYNSVIHSTIGYILVRSASSRYPNKCYQLATDGLETLRLLLQRLKIATTVDKWVVCTTTDAVDDGIENIARSEKLDVVRGNENVYERVQTALNSTGYPDIMLRITADNVFIDPKHIDAILPEFIKGEFDYYRHSKVIDGCDFEIIKTNGYKTLETYFTNYREEAEYMTLYLNNSYFYTMQPKTYASQLEIENYRFTLDYEEDLHNIRRVLEAINNPLFNYTELLDLLFRSDTYQFFAPPNKAFTIKAKKRTLF